MAQLRSYTFSYSWGHHAVGVTRRGCGGVRPLVAASP